MKSLIIEDMSMSWLASFRKLSDKFSVIPEEKTISKYIRRSKIHLILKSALSSMVTLFAITFHYFKIHIINILIIER